METFSERVVLWLYERAVLPKGDTLNAEGKVALSFEKSLVAERQPVRV